jgi:hypothetical protein
MRMASRRWTFAEIEQWVQAMPSYDRRTGKRIPTRAEWEQLSRWRRWRDILLGWEPRKPRSYFQGL